MKIKVLICLFVNTHMYVNAYIYVFKYVYAHTADIMICLQNEP